LTAPFSWSPTQANNDELAPPVGGADCWAVALNQLPPAAEPAATALLNSTERERAARFHFDHHRRIYIASHAALRLLLGRYLRAPAASIEFVTGTHGRPMLADAGSGLHFNLSHSGNTALIAFSRIALVGVDVEAVRAIPDLLDLARHYFAPPEITSIAESSPTTQLHAFLTIWTRKEAFVKALGLGLSVPLDAFSVGPADRPGRLTWLRGGTSGDWTIAGLSPGPDCVGALAVQRRDAKLHCRAAPWPWLVAAPHG
jgi:4'-phosphopantetheinyl transferase